MADGLTSPSAMKEVLLRATGAADFSPHSSSLEALSKCLFPEEPVRQVQLLNKSDMMPEARFLVEQQIRSLVFDIGCEAETKEARIFDYAHPLTNGHATLPRLLDMVLSMGDSNHLEPGFIFTLVERLVDMTLEPEECHTLIDWILRNKETLKKDHIFDRGKLILLRTVNRMLRILQKGEDHAFYSGRLLFFMSELYPMAERSATNHSGLRDVQHPVKMQNWNDPMHDDLGKPVDKGVYELYWKTMEHVQRTMTSEQEAMRSIEMVHRLLDFFKSHPCRRDASPYLTRTPVTLVNDTTPEQFTDIIRDPDSRMECIVQIYVFAQRLLGPFKHPIITSEPSRQRLSALLSDLDYYVRSDPDLRQRWTPIHHFLQQEPGWIEWKNEGATDWTLAPIADHPWDAQNCRPMDEQYISDIHACLDDDSVDVDMDVTTEKQSELEETSEMKATEKLHVHFNRDLELPDFDELRVPTAKVSHCQENDDLVPIETMLQEFLDSAFETPEEMEASMDILEADTSFCWRTYRLLSEHDIQHMVDAEHRTNFGKLLKATQSMFG